MLGEFIEVLRVNGDAADPRCRRRSRNGCHPLLRIRASGMGRGVDDVDDRAARESAANAAGVIDTSVPGPHLTELGRQQAAALAGELAGNNYDGVYASSTIRTQETAGPLASLLGQQIVVLPGLREIDAGAFEGHPRMRAEDASDTYWCRSHGR